MPQRLVPTSKPRAQSVRPMSTRARKVSVLERLADRTTIKIDVAKCLFALATVIMALAALVEALHVGELQAKPHGMSGSGKPSGRAGINLIIVVPDFAPL